GLQPLREAPGVGFFGLGEGLEPLRDLVESLVACCPREAWVHLGELVRLPLDRRLEVQLGRPDGDVGDGVPGLLQEVEMAKCVARFSLGRVAKEPADVWITLDVGTTSEIEIAAVRL